jgi:hypothetical protein
MLSFSLWHHFTTSEHIGNNSNITDHFPDCFNATYSIQLIRVLLNNSVHWSIHTYFNNPQSETTFFSFVKYSSGQKMLEIKVTDYNGIYSLRHTDLSSFMIYSKYSYLFLRYDIWKTEHTSHYALISCTSCREGLTNYLKVKKKIQFYKEAADLLYSV